MTPRFGRTRRFANPYIMLAVDGVFIVIWISAFSTQAAYNSSGACGGSCGISKAIVAVGVFVTYVSLLISILLAGFKGSKLTRCVFCSAVIVFSG